jgi:predicted nucleic-acid-binding protein
MRNREPLFLPAIDLCELVWVLAHSYGQTKSELIHELEQILEMDQFRIEYDALVRRSLQAYRVGRGNFSDYLIGEISMHHGCRDIVTERCVAPADSPSWLRKSFYRQQAAHTKPIRQ